MKYRVKEFDYRRNYRANSYRYLGITPNCVVVFINYNVREKKILKKGLDTIEVQISQTVVNVPNV